MKTLKVEGVYPMAFESAEDVAEHLLRFIDSYNERRLHSALGYLSPNRFEEEQSRKPVKAAAGNCPTPGAHSKPPTLPSMLKPLQSYARPITSSRTDS